MKYLKYWNLLAKFHMNHVLMGDMAAVLKNALCFIIGYLFAMEIRATLFSFFLYDPINVCTDFEINRFKIDEFRKHAQIVCFI